MQVNISRENMLKGVGRTLGVVDRRGTMPILSHFLMQTGESQIMISATDLEVSFRGVYPAEIIEPGALSLPAHYFFNLVKDLPAENLELRDTETSSLHIQVAGAEYQLRGLPKDQFPPVPEITDEMMVPLESGLLREMIEKTIFSISMEELQYHLAGIFWERLETEQGFVLRLVSTDGHRLSLIQRPFPESENFPIGEGIIVPRKGVAELSRLLSEEKEINLALSRKSLALKAGDNFLFVRLLEKKFPDYRRIVPESFKFRFLLSRLELLNILKRISLLSTERFKGVVFHFHPDTLEATFTNPEVGEGREVIPHNLESGQEEQLPLQVGFNARYLLEPLNIMASEQVALEVNDSDHPCRLSEPKDPDYSAIIMPWSL